MLPARERLDADELPGGGRDLGLVVRGDLAVLQRIAELADERQTVAGAPVAAAVVALDARPRRLGAIHRDVRALEQVANGRTMIGMAGDADADTALYADAQQRDRLARGFDELPRDRLGGGRVPAWPHEYRELVAAQARE